jgi:glycine oxidase
MMRSNYEAVVIGGGIIGCAIAYYLAKEKMDVAVVEGGRIGEQTTAAAAGMLGAHSESNGDFSVFFPFARKSQQAYIELKDDLYALSGVDIGYREGGILKLAFSEREKQHLSPLLKRPTVQWMDDKKVKEMEPNIASDILGAAYIRDDASVMPDQTCEAFSKSAQVLGASIFENNYVYSIEKKGMNYSVRTANGDLEAKYVVLATGVFSNGLFKNLGIEEELSPVKGESLIVHHEKPILKHTLFHDGSYIVPRNNGKLVIGATMVENDWSNNVSLQGMNFLIEKAKSLLPEAGDLKIDAVSAGLRPATFDERPFIGAHPTEEGIFIACGHFRNGILLAPATGQMIRDFILGKEMDEKLVEAFLVDRRQYSTI